MMDTLSREYDEAPAATGSLPRIILHRPASPRPVLRPLVSTAGPTSLPPSERRQQPIEAGQLRLTRRGRVAVLVASFLLLFVAFSAGHVMSNAATAKAKPSTHTVVVAPGDTAWSIAHAAMPHLDGREALDRLLALNHSDGALRAGQTLVVPGS